MCDPVARRADYIQRARSHEEHEEDNDENAEPAELAEVTRDGPAKRAAPRESLAQNTNRRRMWFVFSRGFRVAHAGRLRRPPVALGEAAVFFVSFVTFVFFVV